LTIWKAGGKRCRALAHAKRGKKTTQGWREEFVRKKGKPQKEMRLSFDRAETPVHLIEKKKEDKPNREKFKKKRCIKKGT